jgi:hypothetical protein
MFPERRTTAKARGMGFLRFIGRMLNNLYLYPMTNTDNRQQAVEAVLARLAMIAKPSNRLGVYVSHKLTNEGDYTVTLTNGRIMLYASEIKSLGGLPDVRIPDILARFIPQPQV